jgi:anthranilate synthase/aminodeoxychorismate synthase-like glutamine amidotransferase
MPTAVVAPADAVRLVLLDNYDSFTFNLHDYLCQLGAACVVFRNDEPALLESLIACRPQGLVLSPGPCRPADAGGLMAAIEYFHDKIPVLGVCLGHQAIGEFFGAELVHAARPMHGKTSVIECRPDPLFQDLPERFDVMRYHSLVLKNWENTPLVPLASVADASGELMALRHRNLPIWGVQFHPESILTEYGLELMGNWLRSVRRSA